MYCARRVARCLRLRYLVACVFGACVALLLLSAPPLASSPAVVAAARASFLALADEDGASPANANSTRRANTTTTAPQHSRAGAKSPGQQHSLPAEAPTPGLAITNRVELNETESGGGRLQSKSNGSDGVASKITIGSSTSLANETAALTHEIAGPEPATKPAPEPATKPAPDPAPKLAQTLPTGPDIDKDEFLLPVLYIITPTYRRMEQLADLTRLAQTLMHVPSIFWIVVEDSTHLSAGVKGVLERSGINHTHLLGPKPHRYNKPTKKTGPVPRGVSNRLAALAWVRAHARHGVLYFADDDNTYDIRLFQQMRWTKKVSMWPVGLVTQLGISSPIVRNGKVVGFYDGWIAMRKFPVDMAGFAVNVHLILEHVNATMPFHVGYEEDGFLRSLGITLNDIEPKANNCSEVLVWHTKTVKNKFPKALNKKEISKYTRSNLPKLLESVT